jgi:hypothetical protein
VKNFFHFSILGRLPDARNLALKARVDFFFRFGTLIFSQSHICNLALKVRVRLHKKAQVPLRFELI